MASIIHRVGIKNSISDIFRSLSTTDGIARWWTADIRPVELESRVVKVRFHDTLGQEIGSMTFEILSDEPRQIVVWKFTDGPLEWIGTDVRFELKREEDYAIVLFSHNNWREAIEFMAHCSMKWATFLLSLKALHETGAGKPSPLDVKIDNWN